MCCLQLLCPQIKATHFFQSRISSARAHPEIRKRGSDWGFHRACCLDRVYRMHLDKPALWMDGIMLGARPSSALNCTARGSTRHWCLRKSAGCHPPDLAACQQAATPSPLLFLLSSFLHWKRAMEVWRMRGLEISGPLLPYPLLPLLPCFPVQIQGTQEGELNQHWQQWGR